MSGIFINMDDSVFFAKDGSYGDAKDLIILKNEELTDEQLFVLLESPITEQERYNLALRVSDE